MACASCAAVEAGQAMPPPWRNPQIVTSAGSGLLSAVGILAAN